MKRQDNHKIPHLPTTMPMIRKSPKRTLSKLRQIHPNVEDRDHVNITKQLQEGKYNIHKYPNDMRRKTPVAIEHRKHIQHNHHRSKIKRPTDSLRLSTSACNDSKEGLHSTSTESGGVTYSSSLFSENNDKHIKHDEHDNDDEQALHVLKSILLRESHLQKLQTMEPKCKQNLNPEFENLLDIIRISTVEVVEAIVAWRKNVKKNSPAVFVWNGINYLLKIPSDLDFLSRNKTLVTWLGFSIERNPFIIPLSMEHMPSGGGQKDITCSDDDLLMENQFREDSHEGSGFTKIGGRKPPPNHRVPLKSMNDKNGLRPYNTPILNDKEMMPVQDNFGVKPVSSNTKTHLKNTYRKNNRSHKSCSFVGDLDMLRFRQAERVIISEEAVHGRFLRNSRGKLVPAWMEERHRLEIDIRIDDGCSLDKEARTREGFAPFAVKAGSFHKPLPSYEYDQIVTKESLNDVKQNANIIGAKQSKRSGGEFFSFPSPGKVEGRPRPPPRRNRSYFTEIDLTLKKGHIKKLEGKIKQLRDHLNDLERNSSESKVDPKLNEKQSSCSDVVKDKASKFHDTSQISVSQRLQNSCDAIKKEILDLENTLSLKKKQKLEREKQLIELQRIEKNNEDNLRARALESKRRMLDRDENNVSLEDEVAAMTLEDLSITSIQRIVRGILARSYCRRMRIEYEKAAATIQGAARGLFDRRKIKHVRQIHLSATVFQRFFRGKRARIQFSQRLVSRLQQKAILLMQKCVRGMLGRKFVRGKRNYEKHARDGAFAVSAKELLARDLHDLADVVQESFIDPKAIILPQSVLGLIRIVSVMLQSGYGLSEITNYSLIGARSSQNILHDMSWEVAMKFLRRTSNLIKSMQNLAMGPTLIMPRKLHLPKNSIHLYHALENDHDFSLDKMSQIGKGSRAACQLLKWVKSLILVYYQQGRYVVNFYDVPDWLKTLRSQHKERRDITVLIEVKNSFLNFIKESDVTLSKSQIAYLTSEEKDLNEIATQLTQLDFKIKLQEKRDKNQETRRMDLIKERINELEIVIKKMKKYVMNVQRDVDLDIYTDEKDLENIKLDLEQKIFCLKESTEYLDTFLSFVAMNDTRRKGAKIGIDHELIQRCSSVGKTQGQIFILQETKKLRAKQIGGVDIVLNMKYTKDEEILSIHRELELAKEKKTELESILQKSKQELEKKITHQFDSENLSLSRPRNDNFDEHNFNLSDMIEDEAMAQEERLRSKSFVPDNLLRQNECLQPKLICISRDLSSTSRQKITNQLFSDLNGNSVRVSMKENLGIDLNAFQNILDAGQNIIADVDVGIGAHTRSIFLHCIAITKDSLVPSPSCVCFAGSTSNRKGDPTETFLGVDQSNLRVMQDGRMKEKLEVINRIVKVLTSDEVQQEMVELGSNDFSPSKSHILVLEAVIILLSPDSEFRHPNKNIAAISWQLSKQLLTTAQSLQGRINKVDVLSIPSINLLVLETYVTHGDWPKKEFISQKNRLLQLLCNWIENIVTFGTMLMEAGGSPKCWEDKDSTEVFDKIIIVKDPRNDEEDENESARVGWKSAYNGMLTVLLRDARVHSSVCKIEGKSFHVGVSLCFDKLFFFAEDRDQNCVLVTRVEKKDVDSLLAPNSIERNKHGLREPPRTQKELYSRLTDHLVLTQASERNYKNTILVCKRKLTRLLRESRRISGHLVTVTASENCRGELLYEVYIPQFSITLDLMVTEGKMLKLLPNCDPYWERDQVNSAEAVKLLRPITDRLKIHPRFRTITDMGVQIKQFYNKDNIHNFTFGFHSLLSIGIRMKGGVGKELFSCVYNMMQIPHVITVNEIGRNGVLRIRVYNPIDCVEREIKISIMCRILCLGGTKSNWERWKPSLLKRLSIRFSEQKYESNKRNNHYGDSELKETKPEHILHFDRTIFKTAKKLGRTLFGIQVILSEANNCIGESEEQQVIQIKCLDSKANKQYVLDFPFSILKHFSHTSNHTSDDILHTYRDSTIKDILSKFVFKEKEDTIVYYSSNGSVKSVRHDLTNISVQNKNMQNFDTTIQNMNGKDLPKRKISNTYTSTNYLVTNLIVTRMQKRPITKLTKVTDNDSNKTVNENDLMKDNDVDVGDINDIISDNIATDHSDQTTLEDPPETLIFKNSLKVKHVPLPSKEVLMTVKVFESFQTYCEESKTSTSSPVDSLSQRILRFELYNHISCKKASTFIKGESELLAVIGPVSTPKKKDQISITETEKHSNDNTHQNLMKKENIHEMIKFIVHNRLVVIPGAYTYNHELEMYEKINNLDDDDIGFEIILTKSRMYSHLKETPIWCGTARDKAANEQDLILIDKITQRGTKIMRKAVKISGILLNLTAFELTSENKDIPAPTVRFIAYHSESCEKIELTIPGKVVNEVLHHSLRVSNEMDTSTKNRNPNDVTWCRNMATARAKYEMADLLSQELEIQFERGKTPQLVLRQYIDKMVEHSKNDDISENQNTAMIGQNHTTGHHTETRNIKGICKSKQKSDNLLLRAGFNLSQDNCPKKCHHCIVSVYSNIYSTHNKNTEDKCKDRSDMEPILFNVYVPNLSEFCELMVWKHEQEIALGGRTVLSFGQQGEAMEIALRKVIDCLVLSFLDDDDDDVDENNASEFVGHDRSAKKKTMFKQTRVKLRFAGIKGTPSWCSAYLRLNK